MNTRPLSKSAGPGITPAIKPLIFAITACVIAVALFSPVGIIYKHADLSFLTAPFISFFILRFCSELSFIYLPGYGSAYLGAAAACIFNGLAFSLFLFLFFSNAELLTRIGWFRHIEGFLAGLSVSAGYAVLFVLGRTVSKLGELSKESFWGKPFYPIAKALGHFTAGLSIWQFLAAFSGYWPPFNEIGLVIFAGMTAAAISSFGHYGEQSKNPFISDASRWLITSRTFEFLIGAFIAVYILVIRPFITDVFRYAAFIEWGIVCLLGWRLFSGIKSGLKAHCAVDIYENDWQKHVQVISNLQGADFPRLGEMQAAFTEDGGRGSLLVYLALLLHENKVSPEEIHRILHPLIDYKDARMPWFAFSWEQKRILKKNEKNRRLILGEIMADLKYILNPGNRTIEEQADEKNKHG